MKQGKLIVNCLKLLDETNGEYIDPSTVSTIPQFKERTTKIIPSINRALHRLSNMGKLPLETINIPFNEKFYGKKNIIVDEEITKDILKIKNITLIDKNSGFVPNIQFVFNSGLFILPPLREGQKYSIIYQPIVKELKENDYYNYEYDSPEKDSLKNYDNDEIPYPDYITNIIPYFVKSELFEEDNPQLAAVAFNKFEALASQIITRDYTELKGVVDVYGLY